MALEQDQINNIVKAYSKQKKTWEDKHKKLSKEQLYKKYSGGGKFMYPEYWHGYNLSAQMYEAILPHAYPNVYPEHLFAVRAPNQTKRQEDWIRNNYKALTMPVFEDFKSTLTRAFIDDKWHINYGEDDARFGDETFSEYVNNQISQFGSLEMYAKSLLVTLKLVDANGIIAVYPDELPSETNDDGEEIIANELVEPQPHYYNCKDIVGKDMGVYYLVETPYKSTVDFNGKNVKDGIVLYLFDDENIYRIEQKGKQIDYEFGDPEIYYNHELGYVPCDELKGTPQLTEHNTIVFQSPFLTSVALLDQVLLDSSYLSLSKATSAFPFMYALGETCTFTSANGSLCSDGQVEMDGAYATCPACDGAGIRSRFSPSGVLLIKPKSSVDDGDTGLSGEYIKFVSPPMDTLKFLREEIDTHMLKARQVIHINNSDQQVQGNEAQTATGSLNKLRSMYAFIKPISDQIFSVWEFTLETIGRMRYGEFYEDIRFDYPTSFDITSPSDYIAIIKDGVDSGMPPSVTYANIYNYIRSINYTDEESNKIWELILNADDLLTMKPNEVALRVANGTVEKYQDVLHNSAPQLIAELIREDEDFLMKELADQIEALNALAVSKLADVKDPFNRVVEEII